MFDTFVKNIATWLEANELTQSAAYYSGYSSDPPANLPDLKQLERNFLKAIVPGYYSNLLTRHPFHLEQLLNDLFQFGSYLTDSRMRNLVNSGILGLISPSEKNLLCQQLSAFLAHQNKWNDSSWHHLMREAPQEGFSTINSDLLFDNDWACASFLADSGYEVPYSEWSVLGWQKWSGATMQRSSVLSWWQTLNSSSKFADATFKLDRWLDSIFNPVFTILDKPLCVDGASCTQCPLKNSCNFYKISLNPEDKTVLWNQVKTGDIKKLSTQDLLILLSGESWFETESQQKLIAAFPDISQSHFSEISTPAEDNFLCRLLGIKELVKRIEEFDVPQPGKSFTGAGEIYHHFKQELSGETQESFYTAILDNKHRIISKRLITLGTLNQSLVHPREVFAPAIQLRAAAIILIHNHPSGDPTPSNQDIAITQRLQDVGDIVGIKVLDHVIIGNNRFFSFVDENLIS